MKLLKYYLILLLFWAQIAHAESDSTKPLTFGVLPIMSPVTLFKRFTPLSRYLSERLPRPVIIQSARDFPTFVRRVDERSFDLVFTAPHFVDLALDEGRYEILVTPGRRLAAHVVVRKESTMNSLEDLRGKLISHAPDQAFIPIVGRALFEDAGLGEVAGTTFVTMRSHNAAYEAVEGGEVDAAIISSYVATRQLGKDEWRTIAHTKMYPGVAILVASDLDPELKSMIKLILLNMQQESLGQEALTESLFHSFVPAENQEYYELRRFLKFAPGMQHYLVENP